jgi:peptidyl-prolyl cis-trans isomerase C
MSRQVILFLVIHSMCAGVYSQTENILPAMPVARIGNEIITAEEFRWRFEMTVWPGKHRKGYLNTVKQRFLYGMIAEKLLAMEAIDTGFEIHPEFRRQIERLERMYVRDRLYRDLVQQKVNEAIPDIKRTIELAYTDIHVTFFHAESYNDISAAWDRVQAGTRFEELESSGYGTLIRNYRVTWEKTHPELLNVLDSLHIAEISEPVETPIGWYILRIDEIQRDERKIENELLDRLRRYEDHLMRHSYEIRDSEFLKYLIEIYDLNVNAELFDMLTSAIEAILLERYGEELYLYEELMFVRNEIEAVRESMRENLDTEFMRTEYERWSLDSFIADMYNRTIRSTGDENLTLNRRVRNMVNDQILDYLITKKAYELQLYEDDRVRTELERWKRHYLAESYKQYLTKDTQVEDFEVYNYYEDHREEFDNPIEVNIREILVHTRSEAIEMLRMLEEGRDFAELARKYSIRNWSARQGGEFGYFPSTSYGEIGRIAAMLEPGQRIGPILIDEGYTIFELIDKRPGDRIGALELEEVEGSIEERLLGRKRREVINEKVKMLADKYIVDIDYETLHNLEVSPLQVLVIRHFGFGGIFPAVPLLDQILQWSEEWLIDHNLAL